MSADKARAEGFAAALDAVVAWGVLRYTNSERMTTLLSDIRQGRVVDRAKVDSSPPAPVTHGAPSPLERAATYETGYALGRQLGDEEGYARCHRDTVSHAKRIRSLIGSGSIPRADYEGRPEQAIDLLVSDMIGGHHVGAAAWAKGGE